ncbi:putative transmembrane protein [Schizophyllum commune]
MADSKPNRAARPLSGSRSFAASQSLFPQGTAMSTSRPFLNMLNPMGRTYQGYMMANQSPVEEAEEEEALAQRNDLEAGGAAHTRRVSWDAGAELDAVRPDARASEREESEDDEVPQSFMIEDATRQRAGKQKGKAREVPRGQPLYSAGTGRSPPPVLPLHNVSVPPRPSEVDVEEARAPSSSHDEEQTTRMRPQMRGLDAYEKALWNWVNVYNLDGFLQDVYNYYEGKGIYCIALSRGLNLLTVGFVIAFSTFLIGCVDYSRIKPEKSTRLSDVVVRQCVSKFSGFTLLFFMLFTAFYVWQIVMFVLGVRRLVDMYHFYTHLLKIPDSDIQTIPWSEVVRRIGAIREENPLTAISSKNSRNTNDTTTAKLDAHDVANRILRQENYLIALFNKELLDLRVPLPSLLKRFVPEEQGKGKMLTKALEWNLRFCLMEYLFDRHGRVRKVFLKSRNRAPLIEGLRRRFIFMGILNAVFAPFIVSFILMYSFFRYFEEYHKDPSTIGGRQYTLYAQWKFREFNELPHFFKRRLHESYPVATSYIGQFPNEKMKLIMRFVAFVAGSFTAVLVLASIADPDLVVHFEITPHGTVLFWISVFGGILATARGMIPDDHDVFDPEQLMMEVITHTHYMPDEWKGELHSKKTHAQFGELFQMKILIFVQEILSVLLTPFVLWYSLPPCAPAIIDFFREFSVHVEGRGYVCSFAEFNFERHGNVKFGAPKKVRDKRMVSNEGKMEKSFLNFKAANPDWNPSDPTGSLYLSKMADITAHQNPSAARRRSAHLEHSTFITPPDASTMTDRAQEYDRALLQSQHAARRRHGAGSVLGMSTLQPPGGMASSVYTGPGMAQTAVLGDSQGSVMPQGRPEGVHGQINDDDLAADGGVASGLEGSYVDGARRTRPYGDGQEEEEEEEEDGGVLGLLAQIYGGRQGPTRVL